MLHVKMAVTCSHTVPILYALTRRTIDRNKRVSTRVVT